MPASANESRVRLGQIDDSDDATDRADWQRRPARYKTAPAILHLSQLFSLLAAANHTEMRLQWSFFLVGGSGVALEV